MPRIRTPARFSPAKKKANRLQPVDPSMVARPEGFEPPTPKFVVGGRWSGLGGSGRHHPVKNGEALPDHALIICTSNPVFYRLIPPRSQIGTKLARSPVETRPPSARHDGRGPSCLVVKHDRLKRITFAATVVLAAAHVNPPFWQLGSQKLLNGRDPAPNLDQRRH